MKRHVLQSLAMLVIDGGKAMMSTRTRVAMIACSCVLLAQLAGAAQEAPFEEVTEPFAVGTAAPQKAWVEAPSVSASNWQPAEQENLAQELASAKPLKLLEVAPAPRRVSQGRLPYFCPNPDGRSWDIINPYHRKYLSEGQVLVHDFGSGESKLFRYGTGEGENIATPHQTDFHMKASTYLAGKLIFVLPGRSQGLIFLVYDPAVNDFVSATTPFGGPFDLYGLDIGRDGKLCGMGQSGSRDGLQAFVFDPETFKTRIYAKKGGQKNPFPYYRGSAIQGDWMYCKYGHAPWHLVAFNFKTEEFRLLATTQEVKGDHRTIAINRHVGGLSARIKQAANVTGVALFDRNQFECWLVDGEVVPRTGDIPPWSTEPAERRPRAKHRFREFQRWPEGFACDVPPPEIKNDSSAPVDTEGNVALSYRLPGQEDWRTLRYKVTLYPGIVRRLIEVNADTLFAVDEGYGQHLFYDLKGRRLKRFLVQRVSPYAIGVVAERVVVAGYPTFVTVEYDLTGLPTTKAPKFLGYLGKQSDTHTPLGGLAGGADGCVYIAGTTVGRRRDGGGMVWYNMKNDQVGSRTMVDHRIFWLTSAEEKRYILLSSKAAEGSRIFCWDTRLQKFIYDIASPTESHAGPIEEALPGLVMGHAVDGDGGLLYGLEAATGKVLWRKKVPVGPVTAFSRVRRHAYTFRRGPDGFIWASFGSALVRIDPRNATVAPVGKMDPVQIAFAKEGVYVSGGANLRRIEGLRVRGLPVVARHRTGVNGGDGWLNHRQLTARASGTVPVAPERALSLEPLSGHAFPPHLPHAISQDKARIQ